MANRNRNIDLKFRVNEEEKTFIEMKMKEAGITNREAYLRKMAIDGAIIVSNYDETKKLTMELNKIGTNINQIARVANIDNKISNENVKKIEEMMQKVWRLQRYGLSKKTLDKAINYILDPIKSKYVYSYACAPETADLEFELTLDQNSRSGGSNKAYHIIQSFKPEEISPEQAHEIGKQLLEQHLQGKHEYILTTHIDKEHIHNHVIFCASSFVDHKKI